MKYFPYERFTITTSLKPEEVYQRLEDEIKPPAQFSFKDIFKEGSPHYFKGFARQDGFKITPRLKERNSFLPLIRGSISPSPAGTQIEVSMTLHPSIYVFMFIWLGFALVAIITILVVTIEQHEPVTPVIFPMFMFGVGYSVALYFFKSRSFDARYKLVNMFRGKLKMLK